MAWCDAFSMHSKLQCATTRLMIIPSVNLFKPAIVLRLFVRAADGCTEEGSMPYRVRTHGVCIMDARRLPRTPTACTQAATDGGKLSAAAVELTPRVNAHSGSARLIVCTAPDKATQALGAFVQSCKYGYMRISQHLMQKCKAPWSVGDCCGTPFSIESTASAASLLCSGRRVIIQPVPCLSSLSSHCSGPPVAEVRHSQPFAPGKHFRPRRVVVVSGEHRHSATQSRISSQSAALFRLRAVQRFS